jgi:hypothetical protein
MKRKITGAILIFLGLGFLWQALGQADCKATCHERLKDCQQIGFRLKCIPCIQKCDDRYRECMEKCHI